MGRATTAALICAGLVAAGCNDDSDARDERDGGGPRAVAENFIAAVTRGDATGACRHFLPRSARVWFRGPCVPRPSMPLSFEAKFAGAEVQGVRAGDTDAEVAVQTGESGVTGLVLKNTADGWKIFNLSAGSRAGRQDQKARLALTRIGIAFSAYLDDHGDSFAGATVRDLRKYADDVPAGTKVTSTANSVTISVPSQSGNVFRMRQELRRGEIDVEYDCRVPGVAGCPAEGG